jgi:hypothetical protein
VVPARGQVTSGKSVEQFRNMIIQVRDRVGRLEVRGLDEKQAIAEHPTAEFDARWGKGRVRADDFVRAVYSTFKNHGYN